MKINRFVLALMFAAILLLPASSALAAPVQEASVPGLLDAYAYVAEMLPGLGFTLMLLAGATNLLKKKYGDGKATAIYNILMAGTLVGFTLLKLFIPDVNLSVIDTFAQELYDNFAIMLPTLMIIIKALSKPLYDAIRGLPWVGFSFSLDMDGKLPLG